MKIYKVVDLDLYNKLNHIYQTTGGQGEVNGEEEITKSVEGGCESQRADYGTRHFDHALGVADRGPETVVEHAQQSTDQELRINNHSSETVNRRPDFSNRGQYSSTRRIECEIWPGELPSPSLVPRCHCERTEQTGDGISFEKLIQEIKTQQRQLRKRKRGKK